MMNRNSDFIPFARPSLGREEEEAALRVIRSGWLTTGAEAKAFEEEFAAYLSVPRALAVNSATAGLHLALEALGVGPGDRVITSPYTFTASAETARYLGAEPLFVDIAEGSFNVDAGLLEAALRKKKRGGIKAAVPVHVGGLPCDMPAIMEACAKAGCAVVEDAAHSFPSMTPSGWAGCLGDVGVFSFYATKTITTGEGGMIVTRREELARRMSVMRLHGIDREAWNRYTSEKPAWRYAVVEAGYKYNLTDLAAAIGREQLKKAAYFLKRRAAIAGRFQSALAGRDWLRLPPDGPGNAWHLYIIRIVPELLSIGRDELISKLAELGIGTSVHYIPLHIMPYYRKRYGLKPQDFPRSLAAYESAISLPIYPGLSDEQVERVVAAVLEIGDGHRQPAAF